MKEQYHEAVTELKWLRLIDKLLFEEIKKIEDRSLGRNL
jgi:hypothetical protein